MEKIMQIMRFAIVYGLVAVGYLKIVAMTIEMVKATKQEEGKGGLAYAALAIIFLIIVLVLVLSTIPTFILVTPGLS